MSWLEFLTRLGLGACLADDMGLGKTLQVLALLLNQEMRNTKVSKTKASKRLKTDSE
ncbi:MAG: SNF2-related protein [Myxococcota bacterium]